MTFFAANHEYFGSGVRQQDRLYSLQGHAIYNFSPKLWVALDGTYCTGGRAILNGSLENEPQRNSRRGGTFAYPLDRQNSLKFYCSSGLVARTGTESKVVGAGWQYRWGAGL